jgi:hypothetical protein
VSAGLRCYQLVGSEPALCAALNVLLVRADVRGIEERPDEREVWLAQAWPDGVVLPADVEVRELTVHAAQFAHTGRERDAAILIAPDLCVRPPWVPRPTGFAGVELVVPRGGAFGSGEHASTRAALLALHSCWPAAGVDTFVDVGTGSGILALYGAVRGVARVVACDIDLDSVRAACALVPGVRVVCSSARGLGCAADVVVANLAAHELRAEIGGVADLWSRTRGLFVLSGLRGADEVAACRADSARLHLSVPRAFAVDEFTALAFVPGGAPAR